MNRYLDNQLLHPKTKKQAEVFLNNLAGSLLILGASGSGKLDLAKSIAAASLAIELEKLENNPYYLHTSKPADKQEISIDSVRDITSFLRLKTPGKGGIRRVILIENAQKLSEEAQNALLKVLEEPNNDSLFILTALYKTGLLPTITSRCLLIQVYPVTLVQAGDFFSGKYSSHELESAWRLSQGSPTLLNALLSDGDSHPLKLAVEQAKEFLAQSRYGRTIFLDKFSKNREELIGFLEALSKVLRVLHHSAVHKDQKAQIKKLADDRRLTERLFEAVTGNGNLKLATLELIHHLKV